ncbi:hypothetical protein [Candidatus Absconditicoccus praedator]|uniref:hypothetical protein n=1 Tax=Candidatus Absconditicoccus praedator TaxID=2735562 RepID=UPI001E52F8CD|nr:hypothetical protein [Candidatus Absconditicoccus praedator]UFX83326.1 hypothetical protein HLG78_04325 [Candidatus Absconditicoccus praedator]
MKKAKFFIGAFLVGQIATLFYKDQNFKKKFNEVEGLEKVKLLFNNVVDLNKKIFFDIKEFDYEGTYYELKDILNNEISKADEKIKQLKDKADEINKEKIIPVLEELEKKADYVQNKLYASYHDLDDKYDLESKYYQLKEKIEEIRNKVK